MINHLGKPSVGNLFSSDEDLIFEIPRYQREYTWGQREWENLFDDVMENPKGYFLGTIIVIDKGHDAERKTTTWEIIDGQQRLTTVSILLASFYAKMSEMKEGLDEEDRLELTLLKKRLVGKSKKPRLKLIPQAQGSNLDDYRYLILGEALSLDPTCQKPAKFGIRRIAKAYRYFCQRIEKAAEEADDKVEAVWEMLDKVRSAIMVQISVRSHADAYTLFESLNNRGVPLTAVDLIKNTLLSKLGGDEEELDDYFEQWQGILGKLGDSYAVQERFFRQSYDAFRREVNEPHRKGAAQFPLGPVATKTNLLDIYEKQIDLDAAGLLAKLKENASVYAKIILVDEVVPKLLEKPLEDLSHIQGAPSFLLMLALMKKQKELDLSDAMLAKVIDMLVSFFVRRNLTDVPPTRDLTRLFISIVEEMEDEGASGEEAVAIVERRLREASADVSRFRERLEGPIYETNPDSTRFVLAALAEPGMTKESRGLWERDKTGKYVWTIEHVFPQGKNIPGEWVDMIAGGDRAGAEEIQSRLVHTIGNLTLTGYNSNLSNLSFEQKKDRKNSEGAYVGYRNGLDINEFIVKRESWTEEAILARTEELVERAVKRFSI